MKNTFFPALAILGLASAAHAQKAVLETPVSATASTEATAIQAVSNLFDGKGLQETAPGSGLFAHSSGSGSWFAKVSDKQPVVTFDLGSEKNLTGLHIWNSNEKNARFDSTPRGVKKLEISASSDGQTFTPVGVFPLEKAPGVADYLGQAIAFAAPVKARHLRLRAQSHFGGDRVGLSEVRFYSGAAPVEGTPRAEVSVAPAEAPAVQTGAFRVGEVVSLKGQNFQVAAVVGGVIVLAPARDK